MPHACFPAAAWASRAERVACSQDGAAGGTGLPEEVRITGTAAAHNLVAVALSSRDRLTHRCWDATWPIEQCPEILQVCSHFLEMHQTRFGSRSLSFGIHTDTIRKGLMFSLSMCS